MLRPLTPLSQLQLTQPLWACLFTLRPWPCLSGSRSPGPPRRVVHSHPFHSLALDYATHRSQILARSHPLIVGSASQASLPWSYISPAATIWSSSIEQYLVAKTLTLLSLCCLPHSRLSQDPILLGCFSLSSGPTGPTHGSHLLTDQCQELFLLAQSEPNSLLKLPDQGDISLGHTPSGVPWLWPITCPGYGPSAQEVACSPQLHLAQLSSSLSSLPGAPKFHSFIVVS